MTIPSLTFSQTLGRPRTSIKRTTSANGAGDLITQQAEREGEAQELARFTPSQEGWDALRQIFEALDVSSWDPPFRGGVRDGSPYSVHAQWPDLDVRFDGNMSGPPGWRLALHAIEALVQGDEAAVKLAAQSARAYGGLDRLLTAKEAQYAFRRYDGPMLVNNDEYNQDACSAIRQLGEDTFFLVVGGGVPYVHVDRTKALKTLRALLSETECQDLDQALAELRSLHPERAAALDQQPKPARPAPRTGSAEVKKGGVLSSLLSFLPTRK